MENMQIVAAVDESRGCNCRQNYGESVYCRHVEEEFTPYVRQEFTEIEEAVTFYKIYAQACGFDVRKYTTKKWRDGEIKSKLLVCNRQGFRYVPKGDSGIVTLPARNNRITRVGCKARIRLFMKNGVLVVDRFHEGHNHELISVKDREFMKMSRNIKDIHKYLIIYNSRLGIGASRTYHMCKEQVEGYENIGATLVDFKNFHRDVKCFLHEKDGQLFVDRLKDMAANRPDFFFDHDVDTDNSLRRAIWIDGTAKKNYSVFGDAVSYDPTYTTNVYDMIFTPFTGVDHHKRSVIFGGALISHEDHESFQWVFTRFLSAMGGKEPQYIITDQDPGIIKAVPLTFKTARHRFCMWHIMNKVPTKFGVTRVDYKDFLKKLNGIIWDEDLEAAEFDIRWAEIIEAHGLGDDEWFTEIYNKRGQWVMAHCRDMLMSGVMRTTQRSESMNSFFKKFESKSGMLYEFLGRFESAIEHQRHIQKKLDNDNRHSTPKNTSGLPIEDHGARVYTHAVFNEFQEEVKYSVDTCRTGGYWEKAGVEVTVVKDACKERSYTVEYTPGTHEIHCSCRMFERKGLLCRHVIWILTSSGSKTIPEEYIAKRWTSNALQFSKFDCDGNEKNGGDIINTKEIEMSNLWSELHTTIGLLRSAGVSEVIELTSLIRAFKEKLLPCQVETNKQMQLSQILGCQPIEEITIFPPKQCKNKGSGKRLVSAKSKAIELARKPKRMCNNCKQMAHHDKRNCPNPFSEHPPSTPPCKEESEVESEEEEEDDEEEEEDEDGTF